MLKSYPFLFNQSFTFQLRILLSRNKYCFINILVQMYSSKDFFHPFLIGRNGQPRFLPNNTFYLIGLLTTLSVIIKWSDFFSSDTSSIKGIRRHLVILLQNQRIQFQRKWHLLQIKETYVSVITIYKWAIVCIIKHESWTRGKKEEMILDCPQN